MLQCTKIINDKIIILISDSIRMDGMLYGLPSESKLVTYLVSQYIYQNSFYIVEKYLQNFNRQQQTMHANVNKLVVKYLLNWFWGLKFTFLSFIN